MGRAPGQALRYRDPRLRPAPVFDHESLHPDQVDGEVAERFDELHPAKGDSLVAFGWAMEEDLRKLA